jgi:FLVCR family feline leukemia virus subgroup C receptor-related protein
MAAGCLLRSGIPFFPGQLETMPGYGFEMAGTVLVGIAQPFFQCSPPLLSATWFGSSERALATATAINFNQVGIASAFIVGGLMANTPTGMHAYFDVLACLSIAAAVATLALFRDRPETPPSASARAALVEQAEHAREREEHGQFRLEYPSKALGLLRQRGFPLATATFVASIACTNVVSAFTAPALARAGLMEGMEIDLAGAGFQLAIVLGGIGLGRLVDQTKEFKKVIMSCLVASVLLLAGLGISEGNDVSVSAPVVFALLLALGAAAGPVQPIAAELAVEVRGVALRA